MREDCPSRESLRRIVSGAHSRDELDQLAEHLETCEACRQAVEEMGGDLGTLPVRRSCDEGTVGQLEDAVRMTMPEEPPAELPQSILLDAPRSAKYLAYLDGYDVERVIGAGAMGVVVKAYQESLNRHVAIKIMSPALAQSTVARRRFVDEARHAAELDHDNIVTIHAVSASADRPYIVMSYVKGMSLAELIEAEAPLAPEKAARIARQILGALGHAHARRKVHRDIKPANIMLENDIPKVKITDFGIAVSVGQIVRHSEPGQVIGTPAYMSPEQASGELDVDARSDLFSVGTLLYEMLTGLLPFNATSPIGSMRKVRGQEPPPIRSLNPSVPEELACIVERAMQKDIHARYQTADDFERDLMRFLGDVPRKRMQPKRLRWAAAAVVTAAFIAMLAFVLRRPQDSVGPRPEPKSDTSIDAQMEVHFQRKEQVGSYQLLTPDVLPLRTGDRIQIHCRFDRPLVAYLVAASSTGSLMLLSPKQGDSARAQKRMQVPPGHDEWLPITDSADVNGHGHDLTETLILLARPVPLADASALTSRLGAMGPAPALEGVGLYVVNGSGPKLIPGSARRPLGESAVKIRKGFIEELLGNEQEEWPVVRICAFTHRSVGAGQEDAR